MKKNLSSRNLPYRNLLRGLAFVGLLLALLIALSVLFRPKNNREDFGMNEMKANGILAERENSIDVVALGDSECALAFAPMVLWREQGIAAYNCGTAGQYLYEAYGYLLQALKRQSVQVVLLEANMLFRESTADSWLFSKLERLLPVFRYHNRWKSMRAEDLGPVGYTWRDEYKGHMFYTEAVPYTGGSNMFPSDAARGIPLWNRVSLWELHRLCDQYGIRLVLFSAPSPVNWNTESHNAVQNLAEKWEIPYLDMNLMEQEIPIDWQTETKDAGDHINFLGAEKVSTYLARYLAEQYGLTDHRDDPAYTDWNQDLEVYQEAVKAASETAEAAQ